MTFDRAENHRKYMQDWVRRNREKHTKYGAAWRFENQEKAEVYKALRGCRYCLEDHPACLDFHHIDPATKEYDVSTKLHDYGWKRLLKEIEKCDIVCANCHRKLHAGVLDMRGRETASHDSHTVKILGSTPGSATIPG